MIQWLMENLATILVSAVLILLVLAVVRRMMKNKAEGRSSCGCGCGGCAMRGSCHRKQVQP